MYLQMKVLANDKIRMEINRFELQMLMRLQLKVSMFQTIKCHVITTVMHCTFSFAESSKQMGRTLQLTRPAMVALATVAFMLPSGRCGGHKIPNPNTLIATCILLLPLCCHCYTVPEHPGLQPYPTNTSVWVKKKLRYIHITSQV